MTEHPDFEDEELSTEPGVGFESPEADRPVLSDTVEANEADIAEQLSELPEDEEDDH
jgi:hypothetical protein